MKMSDIFENKLKFKPDYKWPDPGSERECPKIPSLIRIS